MKGEEAWGEDAPPAVTSEELLVSGISARWRLPSPERRSSETLLLSHSEVTEHPFALGERQVQCKEKNVDFQLKEPGSRLALPRAHSAVLRSRGPGTPRALSGYP